MALQDRFSLAGQTAIITGGGKGIGRAIALAFADAGANVVCAARTQSDVDLVAEQARSLGVEAIGVCCDVSDESSLQKLVSTALEAFGKISIVVNNAGGALPGGALNVPGDQFTEDYAFNVTSAYNLCRIAVPHMLDGEGGSVINISSAASRYSQKYFSSYGSAKAALNQLTRLLAAEFAPTVRVNAISPGTIMTDALNQFLDDSSRQKMIDMTPIQSLGEPEDIANAALFLASPAARWMTGKILEVDGGAESTTWPF